MKYSAILLLLLLPLFASAQTGCQSYDNGFICQTSQPVPEGYLPYGVLYNGANYFGYWPDNYCPTLPEGVTLSPSCSVNDPPPEPIPDPCNCPDPDPDPDPIPPPSGDEIARGVPNPGPALGFDPFTYDPAITRTVADVPTTVNAGESILVTGGNSQVQVQFNCTATAPCMLKFSAPVRTRAIAVSGQYFIVDGPTFSGDNTQSVYAQNGANHFVVRNVSHVGTNSTRSNGTSMLHQGGDYAVYYNNTIRNIAVADGSDEVDYMAFSVASGSNIWVIGNTSYQVGGDSLKLGQNVARAGGVHPTNIYVTGNDFGNNGENPIDIKWAVDVVISDNDLHDSQSSVSSSGECTVIHESGDNVHFYDNRLDRCVTGIEMATSGGGARYVEVDGNTFTDVRLGVYNRSGGVADVTNNTFIRNEQMFLTGPNSTINASGNISQ